MTYALAERECEECTSEFQPWTVSSRFCSRGCYIENKRRTCPRGAKPIKFCVECGSPFKQMGPRQRRCTKPACHWKDHDERIIEPWREAQARFAERRRITVERKRIRQIIRGREIFGNQAWRELQERRQREALQAYIANDPDLAALVEEQAKDASRNQVYGLSLDQRIGEDAVLADFVGHDNDAELAFQAKFASGRGYSDSWTDAVVAVVDHKREIDEWAEDQEEIQREIVRRRRLHGIDEEVAA